jgi:hypothetical protein
MIVKFRVVRKDTKAPIQGAKIVLEHGESDGITNSAGEVEIVIFWSGNMMYSVDAAGYTKLSGTVQVPASGSILSMAELGAYVEPPKPPDPGEQIIGSVGTSCDLLTKDMFGQHWYSYRNRYTGLHVGWDSIRDDAEYLARQDKGCFAPPPPPPKTTDDVQKDVDILRGTLQGISSRVQDLISSITELGKGLTDLEARIKAWISESIFELLMKNLNAAAKDYKKQRGLI